MPDSSPTRPPPRSWKRLPALLGSSGSLRGQLVRGGVGSIALKVSSMLLGMALAVLLARTLGPEQYGIYTYVFALVSLMAVPAQFGLPNVLVRETAKAQVSAQWGLMRGLWRWATAAAGLLSLGLALAGGCVAWLLGDRLSDLHFTTLAWGLLLVPLIALGNLRGAALRGLRRVVLGQLPETVLRPGLLILLVLGAMALVLDEGPTAADAMALHAVAAGIAFAVGAALLWHGRPTALDEKPRPEYKTRDWTAAALPLAVVSAMQLINQHTDVLMLGLFRDAEQVGVYRVAVSGAALVAFGLGAITMVAAPHFARIHAEGDMQRLQRVVTASSRVILILTLPVVLAFVLAGEPIIHHLFGVEYVGADSALAVLSLGQLANAAMGSVGLLLMMTGHERDTARGVAVAAGANVLLNFLLIPAYGMNGAAVATASSLLLWNLLLWRAVHQRLGIETIAFGSAGYRGPR